MQKWVLRQWGDGVMHKWIIHCYCIGMLENWNHGIMGDELL